MTIKAELIQASNNTAADSSIFTFRLTYPRKFWLADTLRLSQFFERWLTTSYLVTSTYYSGLMNRASEEATPETVRVLSNEIDQRWALARKVFTAVRNKTRITGGDVKHIVNVFGPCFQQVLKQYKPGERHQPEVGDGQHWYEATEHGWTRI